MSLDPAYTALWVLWLAAFAVIEGHALARKTKGDTLTEHLRKWLALTDRSKWVGRAAMAAFLAWLVWHFLGGV